MTQEEKDLLLKDLCARLQCGVKVDLFGQTKELIGILNDIISVGYDINDYEDAAIEDIKPYLRPISSLTEEEQIELGRLIGTASYNMLKGNMSHLDALLVHIYKNHIDVFGLIDQDLAIEAPEGMYNLNKK